MVPDVFQMSEAINSGCVCFVDFYDRCFVEFMQKRSCSVYEIITRRGKQKNTSRTRELSRYGALYRCVEILTEGIF
jgi:hypothetical protein